MNLRHELLKLFIKDMTERPNDWEVDDCCLNDTLTGRRWWIADGSAHFGQYEPIHAKTDRVFWWLNRTHRKAWHLAKRKAKQLRYEHECMQWMEMERMADQQIAEHHNRIHDQAMGEIAAKALNEGTPLLDALLKEGKKNAKSKKR